MEDAVGLLSDIAVRDADVVFYAPLEAVANLGTGSCRVLLFLHGRLGSMFRKPEGLVGGRRRAFAIGGSLRFTQIGSRWVGPFRARGAPWWRQGA